MDDLHSHDSIAEDVHTLERMGYGQELLRRMSGFSNFAVSISGHRASHGMRHRVGGELVAAFPHD